jgi:hypothetical protein
LAVGGNPPVKQAKGISGLDDEHPWTVDRRNLIHEVIQGG